MSVYSEYKLGYIDEFDFRNYTDPCDYPDEPEEYIDDCEEEDNEID